MSQLSLAPALPSTDTQITAPWIPDLGDGTFKNPVLFADYSDPDAIRVGDDFYLVSSSFHATPGLPILHSRDLVNWTIVNHVLVQQPPADHFSVPRHGQGVWAPSLRHRDGLFWLYYPDPDFGLYLSTATDPAGQWSSPRLVKPGKGLIDPCPFWDDDGQLYLVHGWARSRAGIANLLTLHTLSPDGTHVTDSGTTIIDGATLPGWHTIEGPKLYKRRGYYYVFAPAGGVATGYQAVFRSRKIRGPYESRIVLDQGSSPVNGPHQGAWIDTRSGEDWFLHFQDLGAFGRVVHLQPMLWRDDDWPVIGTDPDDDGRGEPVLVYRKPNVGRTHSPAVPQTSDEFDRPLHGLQWQWNANPRPTWSSLTLRPGFLRLLSQPAPTTSSAGLPVSSNLYDAPHFFLQKFPAPSFTATTAMHFAPATEGEIAGLAVFGYDYAILGLRRTEAGLRLVLIVNEGANLPDSREREFSGLMFRSSHIFLRVSVTPDSLCRFSWSFDHQQFTAIGAPFKASGDRWTGARVGLIASAPSSTRHTGHADFDWFRVTSETLPHVLQPAL